MLKILKTLKEQKPSVASTCKAIGRVLLFPFSKNQSTFHKSSPSFSTDSVAYFN